MIHISFILSITIRDDELIVGSVTEHPRSSEIHVELSLEWLLSLAIH